jgi:hypothetical protein
MENLDIDESSGYSDMGSDKNLDKSRNYSEEDFMVCYGNVSDNSEDTWWLGLELYNDEQTIFSSFSSGDVHSQYQVYAIIDDTSEESILSSTQRTSGEAQTIWQKETPKKLWLQESKFSSQHQSRTQ